MHRLLLIFIFLILFLTLIPLYPNSQEVGLHGDRSKLPKGCGSCHKGHGVYDTPMLPESKNVFCFRCHGNSVSVAKTKAKGDIGNDVKLDDMQREFEKPYHHPIEKIEINITNRILPESDQSMPRHVECGDCHHHHYVTKENKMAGIKGVDMNGARVESINYEYELCFKCHSYSANLPADQTNKAKVFNISNPSYHPVIAAGRNNDVPSLIYPLTTSSIIKCTDCHNNNDPTGPKGPHGSNNSYILSKKFTETDGPEGTFQYELCYNCHRRSSILSNESFQFHALHISSVGTSCRTCHNPHGSTQYGRLIDFNNISIRPSNSGRLQFNDFGNRAGQCFLNCHGKDHDPAVYPAAASKPSIQSPSFYRLTPTYQRY